LAANVPDYIEQLRRSAALRDLNDQYQIIDRLQSAAIQLIVREVVLPRQQHR
jgi:hypothetical protein